MSLINLEKRKKIKDLKNICKEHNIQNYKKHKIKNKIINHIILYFCFHSISNFEDDEFDILKLYFMKIKHFIELNNNDNNNNNNEIENINLSDDLSLLPRPSNNSIIEFIDNLKNKYTEDAEIDFKFYENDRYNDLYKYHKKYNIEQYGDLGDRTEKILIHGTDESKLTSIFENDFSLTINIRHGSVLGKGIYFTNDLELASKYSERGKKDKYYILCNVHVGNIMKGNHRMDMLPKIENQERYYDTSVDNCSNPKQFVKFKNNTYNFLGIIHVKILNEGSSLFKYDKIKTIRGRKPRNSTNINFKTTTNNNNQYSNFILKKKQNKITNILQNNQVEVLIKNKTKNLIYIYSLNEDIRSGKKMILSNDFKKFFNLEKNIILSKEDCWEKIRSYCCLNNLYYLNYQTGIYLPDNKLCELLMISPTTRISCQNIYRIMDCHFIKMNPTNMGYITIYSDLIGCLDTDQEEILVIQKDKHIMCGFFSMKTNFPTNFVVRQRFITDGVECQSFNFT